MPGSKQDHKPMEKAERFYKKNDAILTLINYDAASVDRVEIEDVSHIKDLCKERPGVKWINIDGVQDMEIIESIGMQFGIHFLVLEDIMDDEQRPKIDDYDRYAFIVMKMLYLNEEKIIMEQISFLLFKDLLITIQQVPGDVFNNIRKNIMNNKGRIRKMGADYLAYTLIDTMVDNYFKVLEVVEEETANLERLALSDPKESIIEDVTELKAEVLTLKKISSPVRELLSFINKGEVEVIDPSLIPYFKDITDNIIRIMETSKNLGDSVSGILDIYMSSMSNNMNKIMKVLTIMSTIFIPLTFIAGVYGMNFDFMPELKTQNGYFVVVGVMIAIALALVFFFKRKKWI